MSKFTVHTLAASDGTPLCKSATSSYPNVYLFNSTPFQVKNIKELYTVIKETAKHNMCMLKGLVKHDLYQESRAGATTSDDQTKWICLDLDGVSLPEVEDFIALLPSAFKNVSYVLQESASLGSKPGLRYHIFMVTKQLVSPTILKAILKSINATVDILYAGLELGRGDGNILKYPLDITTCQNDKILYVAPRSDKTASKTHIILVNKKQATLDVSKIPFSPAADKAKLMARRNELRKAAGLPLKKLNTKIVDGKDLITNADEAVIDETKTDNGFIRFNLRGSQSKSFRYYHPVENFEHIHSFGDEEVMYETKHFFPEYYKQCINNERAIAKKDNHQGKQYFAVLDKNTDKYYAVTTTSNADGTTVEDLRVTGSARKAIDFCKEHGNDKVDYIPTWDVTCDFQADEQFNRSTKFINTYKQSEYMCEATTGTGTVAVNPPSAIDKVIRHMLNNDEDVIEHFYNWLAVILQHGVRTETAWLIHGTTGTGKGLICDYVIRPLIGNKYVKKARLEDFASRFNAFMADTLCLFVNEAQMSAVQEHKAGAIVSNVKDCITDEMIRVEGKGVNAYDAYNNCNLIFSSNQHDPIQIEMNDRRINVANRQDVHLKKVMTDEEMDSITDLSHLQEFANYIMHRTADVRIARSVILTEATRDVQSATVDIHNTLMHQIKTGDLDPLIDDIALYCKKPISAMYELVSAPLGEDSEISFEKIIGRMYKSAFDGKPINISRDDLAILFFVMLNYLPDSKYKFSKRMRHLGADIKPIKIDGHLTRGIGPIQFEISPDMRKHYLAHIKQLKRVK